MTFMSKSMVPSGSVSILDARSGYWNLKLDDSSADLTKFNTLHG